jgi:hypothetical protein
MTLKLLQLFFELHNLEPNIENWSNFGDEVTPRSIRKKMIDSLFKAHNLNIDYIGFKKGDFIDEKFNINFEKINQIYLKYRGEGIDNPLLELGEGEKFTDQHANMLFRSFFRYRLDLDKALKSDDGVLAASGYYLLPILTKQKLNKLIIKEVKLIDEILIVLINPLDKTFSKKELNTNFQFPKINLDKLDLDWM